jgi:hypothetical protein
MKGVLVHLHRGLAGFSIRVERNGRLMFVTCQIYGP